VYWPCLTSGQPAVPGGDSLLATCPVFGDHLSREGHIKAVLAFGGSLQPFFFNSHDSPHQTLRSPLARKPLISAHLACFKVDWERGLPGGVGAAPSTRADAKVPTEHSGEMCGLPKAAVEGDFRY
jgi:hypothetical protein